MPNLRIESRHYPALDGLRGLAALMIVGHHFLQLAPAHGRVLSTISAALGCAWMGVDLFFVLSGFLITGILADAKGGKNYFRAFYGRRILRIFPLYYATLVLVLFILPAIGAHVNVPLDSMPWLWTYTTNFYFATHGWNANFVTHLWTLAIEEQFYLVWPLIIFMVRDLDALRKWLPAAFIGVLILRIVLLATGVNSIFLNLVTLTHCDGLLLGSFLALAMRSNDPSTMRLLRPGNGTALVVAVFSFFLADMSGLLPSWELIPAVAFVRAAVVLTLLAIVFVWLVYAATRSESGTIARFFSRPTMRWFGKYSYALYILHVPLGFLILQTVDLTHVDPANALLDEVGLFVLYTSACIGSAFLSWHLFEKHFLKLKRFFPYGDIPNAMGEVQTQEVAGAGSTALSS